MIGAELYVFVGEDGVEVLAFADVKNSDGAFIVRATGKRPEEKYDRAFIYS